MDLKDQLKDLLKQKRSKEYYAEVLNISIERVEELKDEIRNETKDEDIEDNVPSKRVDNERGTIESKIAADFEPASDEELAELHKVNLDKYVISSYKSNLLSSGKYISSISCKLKKVDENLQLQKEQILKELKDIFPERKRIKKKESLTKYAYEIALFDHHFGKLAWGEESGEDYDLEIAKSRYEEAIESLLSMVDNSKIEKIIFPIGNDMINIDSRKNETFAGTRQDSDSRFFKIVIAVKELLIKTILQLSEIAPVDVIVIGGNHDPESMFMMGEILDAYFSKDENITINNSPKQRKYYQYGKNGFQYTHGNEENHKDLGLIFATEQPILWAETEFRFSKLGHFHKNKKTNYTSVDEYQGFQVQILPSLSGSDAWHAGRGYMSKKQAKAFLYDKEKGQIAEYTYSI